MFTLTYDQIDESEQSDSFDTIQEVIEFSIKYLNGSYYENMSKQELIIELESNGYYLN